MDSLPMKWTPVGSHGLEVVLEPPASMRVIYAPQKLQSGSQGSTRAAYLHSDHDTLCAYRQFEPLKTLFFLAREHIGRWIKAAEHVVCTRLGKYNCLCQFGGPAKWL